MRNKRVRALRKEALEIMPARTKVTGSGAYGIGTYSRASNPFKNFIRRHRKGAIK